MANNTHWSVDDLKKKGLIQVNGEYVKASSQVAKKVEKISHKDVIKKFQSEISKTDVILKTPIHVEKLPNIIEQMTPFVEQLTKAQTDMKIIIDKSGPAFDNNKLQARINEINAQEAFDGSNFKNNHIDEYGLMAQINPPAKNAKVKNATKVVQNGISFDSRLEAYLHGLLTSAGIYFEFQKKFELQAKFTYREKTIRPIAIIFDFYLTERNILIDTKGWQTYDGKIKHKMLKSVLKHLHDMQPEIIMPKNKKECDLLLNKLLYERI